MSLPSSDVHELVIKAGIEFVPAKKLFYKTFPYKIDVKPRFKDFPGTRGKTRGCRIDITNTKQARAKLDEFVEKMNQVISNIECREEMKAFIDSLPENSYKARLGDSLDFFYLKDPDTVKKFINKYSDMITSVAGPMSKHHQAMLSDKSTEVRTSLYHGKFRHLIVVDFSTKFADTVGEQLRTYLRGLAPGTWRANRLDYCMEAYYNGLDKAGTTPLYRFPWVPYVHGERVQMYFAIEDDYTMAKLLVAEYVRTCHSVVLHEELK